MMATKIDTWRYHANRWQTWAALTALLLWIVMYAVVTARSPLLPVSTGYWPTNSASFTVPYHGASYRLAGPLQVADVTRKQLVLLGQHDGVPFYGLLGSRVGGGGGGASLVPPRLYAQVGTGRYVALERASPDPEAGNFLPQNGGILP